MDCIFCKIVSWQLPCYKVYEDNDFFAFLDIRPLNPGHTLVVPKKHYRWVWDVENIDIYYKVVQKIVNWLKKTFNTDYIVSLVFWEEVPHAHVWLVPRFNNDWHWGAIKLDNVKNISKSEMEQIAKNIIKNI